MGFSSLLVCTGKHDTMSKAKLEVYTAVRGGGFSVVTFVNLPQGLLTVYRTYDPDTKLPHRVFTNKAFASLYDGEKSIS